MAEEAITLSGIPLGFYVVCWVGSLVLYFQMKSTNKSVIKFLPHINQTWSNNPWALFFDALLVTIVGAYVGTVITEPINVQQALAAGLGWTGLLSIVSS